MVTVNVGNLGTLFTKDAVVLDPRTTVTELAKENNLMSLMKVMGYCTFRAVLHPRTPIELPNPGRVSPVPWWGAIIVIVIGIGVWIYGGIAGMGGLTEAARAMVYLPLGNMFGMAVGINSVKADTKSNTAAND